MALDDCTTVNFQIPSQFMAEMTKLASEVLGGRHGELDLGTGVLQVSVSQDEIGSLVEFVRDRFGILPA